MDPVSLVVGALAVGASQGLADVAVADAYRRLKSVVCARLGSRVDGAAVLDRFEADPKGSMTSLAAAVERGRFAGDADVGELARRVMTAAESRRALYVVDADGVQGIQVGDGNTQNNTFG